MEIQVLVAWSWKRLRAVVAEFSTGNLLCSPSQWYVCRRVWARLLKWDRSWHRCNVVVRLPRHRWNRVYIPTRELSKLSISTPFYNIISDLSSSLCSISIFKLLYYLICARKASISHHDFPIVSRSHWGRCLCSASRTTSPSEYHRKSSQTIRRSRHGTGTVLP